MLDWIPMAAMNNAHTLNLLDSAVAAGQITTSAAENIRSWLTDACYADYAEVLEEHLVSQKYAELNRVFWKIIEFGTGGRRGGMYPIGSAAINDRTMGESAAGLAAYVKSQSPSGTAFSCAIAYDTRHNSRHFARLSAEILVASGFKVYFLDGFRSTPELSFAVRFKNCCCGIMITASHNPPSDNGFKAYWNTGGQLVPPHDKGVIEQVMNVGAVERADFDEATADGRIEICQEEIDAAFFAALKNEAFPGPRDLKVVYSPLHGVGGQAAMPALVADGFTDVELFGPHATPDGDFPNVPDHVSNPENAPVFDAIIDRCREIGADIALASDPDCDRIGCAAPVTMDTSGPWATFTGNQICGLLCEYVLSKRQAAGTLTADNFVVTTLVTTALVRRIADSYLVKTYGNLLVGFKWIAEQIDISGPDRFVYGTEESHGYMVGQYVRDKDGAVAAMLMAELAAETKAAGKSLHQKLDELFLRHGCHAEKTVSLYKHGETGMQDMKAIMARLRQSPPSVLGDLKVESARDYLRQTTTRADGTSEPLDGPVGDLIIFDLHAKGNYVAVRPSGTEPKIKFYQFAYHPPEDGTDLAAVKTMLENRLISLEHDLRQYAEA
ncbi:MAG: phospho-sugar mutase [Pirellulales bacterium]